MELQPETFKKFMPQPLGLITTANAKGIVNAAPYTCMMPVLKPLDMIAVASFLTHDTLQNIRDTKQFVVNILGKPSLQKALKCGEDYPPEVNELEKVGLETSPSKKVSPPRIKEAIGWIEVILEKEIVEEKYALLIGKVIHTEINDLYCKDGKFIEHPVVWLANIPHTLTPYIMDSSKP